MKKIRVFDSPEDLPKGRSGLLAISNKYGLTFVGLDRTLKVFLTKDIIAVGKVEGNPNEIGKREPFTWPSPKIRYILKIYLGPHVHIYTL